VVVELHLDPLGARVAAHVGERLLCGAVDREPGVGGEPALLAADVQRDREPALLPERLGERPQALGAR
jgi:hypothetical protein